MKFAGTITCCCLLLILLSPGVLHAQGKPQVKPQGKPQVESQESCRAFVQGFYAWYLREIRKEHGAGNIALKLRSSSFSPELVKLLKEDEEASAKNSEEIVGLDFDPFLNCQDDPGQFITRKITTRGGNYLVDLFRVEKGPIRRSPAVVAELAFRDGRWIFVNFHYPSSDPSSKSSDLITILKDLREERKHPDQ